MRKLILGAVALAVGLLAAPAVSEEAAAPAPSVTVTSPKANARIDKSRTPKFKVAGGVRFLEGASAGETKFFLRRDDCGGDADNPRLSTEPGVEDGGDRCGSAFNFVPLAADVAEAAYTTTADERVNPYVDFPTVEKDGVPLTLDAKPITGTLTVGTWGDVSAGRVDIEISLIGTDAAGDEKQVGSTTVQHMSAGDDQFKVDYEISPEDALAGTRFESLLLRVLVRGPQHGAGWLILNGESFVSIPTGGGAEPGKVLVSVDKKSFAGAKTAKVTGTKWNLKVKTPNPGKHTIFVRAVQGDVVSKTVARKIRVIR